ncbi:DsbE family thiol:disulfide interchange protein [Mergibacter septicus]|uniref:DsbE family thiol:disulfide interchange protein n=1 Tax=Mergibacter septicus TaxID=221402 RepID=A0A8D4LN17_9PAST|nr:DsbE family thiol:disulfide interchange protein [Mergibacter septicus]AWX15063.1 DsbE family thiol:disulfide interchange protein [Mergibacter septicus]QDJ12580.1 DsbE family thiol:disulfide interchange protein [Mergibacter septicus]QDJ14316.1 DsbE family thiol:disulfide interchange protein [Mergibacter septicus]UTU48243.1 DsbE family thiol:disulfide interchange protein [Mergibacter septicus]WMR96139.1 DsbE family thiol:disulfide interchange protein [Mergibacter septicus]
MTKKKLYLPLIIFLGLILAFAVQLVRNSKGEDPKALESALVGKKVPVSTPLLDLFNPAQSYDANLFHQSKPLLVNVWATWCPTCYAEHQYLNQLAKQGIEIIGINYKDQTEKAINWLQNLGNPYQVVISDKKGAFGLDLGVYGAPETFVIDCTGTIHYRYAGAVNSQVWQQELEPLYQRLAKDKQCKQSN